MGNKRFILNRVPNGFLLSFLFLISFFKLIVFILLKNNILEISLGGGNDSGYYNAYAKGYIDVAVNIWPVMLRFLYENGLYSREVISYLFLLSNLIVIPIMAIKISGLKFKKDQKKYLYFFLLCAIYPTLFFYTLDVYRDVFMVISFLVGCLIVKKSLNSSSILTFSLLYVVAVLVGFFLLGLRPYLGYAFLLSLLLWKIKFTKKRIYFLGLLYLLVLFSANYLGLLEALTEYRSIFEETEGGSTLGLDFSNPLMFIPNFILSTMGQLLGLYITNPLSIFILLIETVPFVFMLSYIIKNIRLADSFIRFLIIFFVLYASVWLIGNDNLGTAVRLRMYNYLAIYISFFYILRLKKQTSKGL